MKNVRLRSIGQKEGTDMEYLVKTIGSMKELESCEKFCVDHYNWGGDYRPHTYGRMGFLKGHGFVVQMVSEEKNPVGSCVEQDGMVCRETAMEAFFQFYQEECEHQIYLNFEANVLGTLHAKFGRSRDDRKPFPKNLREACRCSCSVSEGGWTLQLLVPLELIKFIYGKSEFVSGSAFRCNFYKISEEQKPIHFGSFTQIKSTRPDFHLPEYFATAVIE